MPRALLGLFFAFGLACGGGGPTGGGPAADPWAAVTSAIQSAQSQFPGAPAMGNLPAAPTGLTLEVLTVDGVVYSKTFGAFSNQTYTAVASASKMVSGTVLLQLVDKGVLSLDTKTKDILKDRNAQPWSGNMGEIKLRHLLSFTSGISGDVLSSEPVTITLDEAATRIYEDQRSTAATPGSTFYYGFGNWVETQNGAAPSATSPIQRVSSTGKFGWAPWIELGNGQNWAAIIMCQQPNAALSFLPSENLKLQLAPLIQAAVAQHPPVVQIIFHQLSAAHPKSHFGQGSYQHSGEPIF